MDRRSRRGRAIRHRTRGLSLLIGVLAAVGLVAVAPAALAGMGASAPLDEAEITFTDRNREPVCDSVPSVSSITIHGGTRITLINGTGVDTYLDAGQAAELTIADGDGASLRLKPGQHAIRLVPDCEAVGTVKPLVVTVTNDVQSEPGQTSPATAGGGDSAESGSSIGDDSTPGVGDGATGPLPAGSSPAVSSRSGGGTDPAAGIPTEAVDVAGDENGPIESIEPVLASKPDGRPTRLLAIIAAICVFGVSWATVRVILSHRAFNVIGT